MQQQQVDKLNNCDQLLFDIHIDQQQKLIVLNTKMSQKTEFSLKSLAMKYFKTYTSRHFSITCIAELLAPRKNIYSSTTLR